MMWFLSRFMLIVFFMASLGCAGGIEAGSTVAASPKNCATTENLIEDSHFQLLADGPWLYTQHTGERSFQLDSENGGLKMSRISGQPWMVVRQEIRHPKLDGATLTFSAELRSETSATPTIHGFEHIAGLFLQPGNNAISASVAEHTPNVGVWDWAPFSVEKRVPAGTLSAKVGFVHQAGGTLWARNPVLLLTYCD